VRTVFKNREIPGRIHAMQPFLSEGILPDGTRRWSGYSGPATSYGHLPRKFHGSVRQAVYVVYSYGTPIGWVLEVQHGTEPYTYTVPDIGYSVTTGQHQSACLEAWEAALRRQGTYRRFPASHREVVQVPGNAEVYGRSLRARAGGMDGVRPGEVVGRSRLDRDNEEYDGYEQGPPVRDWTGHPSHP
jgi:hypothetical protein